MNSSFSKQAGALFVVTLLGSLVVYQNSITPCSKTITYSIGTFDSRFGISKEEFLKNIETASLIWEKPAQKDLFKLSEKDGDVTINLIYDERQKITEERNYLEADAKKVKMLAVDVRQNYEALLRQYDSEQAIYTELIQNYKQKQSDYNKEVSTWNKKGGAPSDVFKKLEADRNDLDVLYKTIEEKRREINTLVETINTFTKKYNLLVSQVNENIEKINVHAGKEFQEGVYDPNNNSITIYEFESKNALIRVLAHELGHALTLDHNENKDSIMYYSNTSATLNASREDIESLKKTCKL